MPNTPLRGAILGCGFFAQFHADAWSRMDGVRIVAACDADPQRAARFASRTYSSPTELFACEQLDFVDIVTRPDTHLEMVRLAAASGVAIICQKPMAPDWPSCVAMVEAAEQAGVRFMIHENWRWQPWYRAAGRVISEGGIGTPVTYRFRTCKRDGAGPEPYRDQPYFREMPRLLIYETAVHHIDTARFLFGDIGSIYAQTRRINPRIAGEDQAILVVNHESSLMGTISGHRFLNAEPVLGEAWFEGDRQVLRIESSGDVVLGETRVWENTVQTGYRGDSVKATQLHFLDCLQTGKEFETSGKNYLQTFAAVESAYESAASGRLTAVNT